MRYAIIADIHGNLEALSAVLGDIEKKNGVDGMWCLGDIVGYGPDPGACIDVLRRYNPVGVAGNHDRAVIGKLSLAYFNPFGATACRWTTGQLTPSQATYLGSLPLSLLQGDFLCVHGSPAGHLLEYVLSASIAAKNFSYFEARYCLVGHTHAPLAFKQEEETCLPVSLTPGIGLVIGEARMIINPGSVGQPRDGDPRASYAIYDTEGGVLRVYRIPYDIEATQAKMMKAGLPIHLITRLEAGR